MIKILVLLRHRIYYLVFGVAPWIPYALSVQVSVVIPSKSDNKMRAFYAQTGDKTHRSRT